MIVVFLGPTLPLVEAQALLEANYRPPARQGDVFKAIDDGAKTIVLIDGVFEAAPSVWHHELIAAHQSGIRVIGACSMGALRAAELPGVVEASGQIAQRYRTGEWNDDAWVALLHGDAASGFRALSVPLVNVWATVEGAVKAKVLRRADADRLFAAASKIFYQSRTWASVFGLVRDAKQRAWLEVHRVDLKASDARACLKSVKATRPCVPVAGRFSSFVRRSRLGSPAALNAEEGVRRLLIADFARQAGIEPDEDRVTYFMKQLSSVAALDQRRSWAEALALDEMVLSLPERFVNDGPSRIEGAALMAALGGHYSSR